MARAMDNLRARNQKNIVYIGFIFALLLLVTMTACSYGPLTITGTVVDESGTALSDVAVLACYSGWGWSKGQLVWDKDYCSETTLTNDAGLFVISFRGPASSRLMARKEGWVQTQDFNTTHSRITLTRSADHSSRARAAQEQQERDIRQRLPAETETGYYCRVILPATRPINLNYHDGTLSITPVLLEQENQNGALFAVRGSNEAVYAFSEEVVLKLNGKPSAGPVSLKSIETSCGPDVYFIEVSTPVSTASADNQAEILLPSVSAMFDMQLRSHATKHESHVTNPST